MSRQKAMSDQIWREIKADKDMKLADEQVDWVAVFAGKPREFSGAEQIQAQDVMT